MNVGEDYFQNKMDSWPKQDGVALDIGANHGYYTKCLIEKFSQVFAFEPHPDNLVELNKLKASNLEIVPCAVSDKPGKVKLYKNSLNVGGHTIFDKVAEEEIWGHNVADYMEVDAVTLDDFCKGRSIKAIKMDIEGAEDFVWNGAVETLKNNKMDILLETHSSVDCGKLLIFFNRLGYKVYENDVTVTEMRIDTHYLVTNKD